jgi:deoxycytidine triphosphate deaminase
MKVDLRRDLQLPMGILLQQQIQSLGIIRLPRGEPADPACFAPTSYDLRLGSQFFVPEAHEGKKNKVPVIYDCSEIGTLDIPPFSAVLVSTLETVRMPRNVTGRWDLKIKWAMAGLVFQMGTQIEPAYRGRLFGLLYNLSDRSVPIPFRARLWAVEFIETSGRACVARSYAEERLKMSDFIVYGKPSGSINRLAERTNEAWTQLQRVTQLRWTGLLVILTFLMSVGLPIVVTKITYDKDDQPLINYAHLQRTVEDLKTDRDSQIQKLQGLVDTSEKKIAEAEQRFRAFADAERQEWVRQPALYDIERLDYLRRQRDALRATAPASPELKKIEEEIPDIVARIARSPAK